MHDVIPLVVLPPQPTMLRPLSEQTFPVSHLEHKHLLSAVIDGAAQPRMSNLVFVL